MKNNFKIFKQFHPYFNNNLLNNAKSYKLQTTKNKLKTLVLTVNNKKYYLHSNYNPEKEADSIIKNIIIDKYDIVWVLGLGLGYHLQKFIKKYPNNFFIVIELDIDIFNTFINYSKIKMLNNPKIIYLTFYDIEKIQNLISYLYYIKIKKDIKFKIFKYLPSFNISVEYLKIEKKLLLEFSHFYSNVLTSKKFMPIWDRNFKKNLQFLSNSHPLNDLKNKFYNKPLVIVSAGYSLEKNINFIRENKKNMIILVVDTALRFLLKNEVCPDYVLCLDAKYENFFDFKFVKLEKKINLIFDLITFPKVITLFNNRYYTYTIKLINDFYSNKMVDYYDKNTKKLIKEIGDFGGLQSGGSVSTNALDFALFTGSNPIYLIGLDLKYYNYKTHCKGNHKEIYFLNRINKLYNFETLNFLSVINRQNIKKIEGNNVFHYDFMLRKYKKWFDEAFQLIKDKKIIIVN